MSDELLPDLITAVEQQLASPQTRYVKATHERLLKLGLESDEAKEQIALCLGAQMDRVLRSKRAFDEKAYREALDELPMTEEEE
ncbi:MAG TPA: hypothetical protein VFY13_02205 [Luteolibacter sp.]|nr:hypothetical protein [Luteolibacter sp.]